MARQAPDQVVPPTYRDLVGLSELLAALPLPASSSRERVRLLDGVTAWLGDCLDGGVDSDGGSEYPIDGLRNGAFRGFYKNGFPKERALREAVLAFVVVREAVARHGYPWMATLTLRLPSCYGLVPDPPPHPQALIDDIPAWGPPRLGLVPWGRPAAYAYSPLAFEDHRRPLPFSVVGLDGVRNEYQAFRSGFVKGASPLLYERCVQCADYSGVPDLHEVLAPAPGTRRTALRVR